MTSIEKIKYIEEKYQLYKYESWQYLRVVYATSLEKKNVQNNIENNELTLKDKVKKAAKTLFFGLRNWFRRYDYLIFDVNDDYRKIDDIYLSRLTEGVSKVLKRKQILLLLIFMPFQLQRKSFWILF